MQLLNDWLHRLSHNYVLVGIGGILFFLVKGIIGYRTYRHYDRRLRRIEQLLATDFSKEK